MTTYTAEKLKRRLIDRDADAKRLQQAGWVWAEDWEQNPEVPDRFYWRPPGASSRTTPYTIRTAIRHLDREVHARNRVHLEDSGWRESAKAPNRWWPPRRSRLVTANPDKYPCSTLEALELCPIQAPPAAYVAAPGRWVEEQRANTAKLLDNETVRLAKFCAGDFLASVVRAMPDSCFRISLLKAS